jgi:hypothetical protein
MSDDTLDVAQLSHSSSGVAVESTASSEVGDREHQRRMFARELLYHPDPRYLWPSASSLKPRRSISPPDRAKLFEWLAQVANDCFIETNTLQLAYNYVDRLVARDVSATDGALFNGTNYQTVGITCLWIAVKSEEGTNSKCTIRLASEFADTTDGACTGSHIVVFESAILRVRMRIHTRAHTHTHTRAYAREHTRIQIKTCFLMF